MRSPIRFPLGLAACLLGMGCGASHGAEPVQATATRPHHAANHPGARDGDGPEHSDRGVGHQGPDHREPHHGAAHHRRFDDPAAYAELFDRPDRDAWQRPAEVVELLDLSPGSVVVDLGAGTGYFMSHLSGAVGPDGRVLALDVETSMVEWMVQRAGREGLANVEARQVPPDSPSLAPGSVDRILIVNTWHHIEARRDYGVLLRTALRPGGFVLVVDFTLESEHGPPPRDAAFSRAGHRGRRGRRPPS